MYFLTINFDILYMHCTYHCVNINVPLYILNIPTILYTCIYKQMSLDITVVLFHVYQTVIVYIYTCYGSVFWNVKYYKTKCQIKTFTSELFAMYNLFSLNIFQLLNIFCRPPNYILLFLFRMGWNTEWHTSWRAQLVEYLTFGMPNIDENIKRNCLQNIDVLDLSIYCIHDDHCQVWFDILIA